MVLTSPVIVVPLRVQVPLSYDALSPLIPVFRSSAQASLGTKPITSSMTSRRARLRFETFFIVFKFILKTSLLTRVCVVFACPGCASPLETDTAPTGQKQAPKPGQIKIRYFLKETRKRSETLWTRPSRSQGTHRRPKKAHAGRG